jgi:predicted RNase H-like nuclease (RuvC/YqgF family)
MGVLIYPSENLDTLQQRYDTLSNYYTQIQEQNQELLQGIEGLNLQVNDLQNEVDQTQTKVEMLQNDWETIFSEQTNHQNPSVNQIVEWIENDQTDSQTISPEYTPLQQAIQLSLLAKTRNWRVGITTIKGNFSEAINQQTYNIIQIDTGHIIYIEPQTDEVWLSPNFDEITPNRIWNLGEYQSVYVTEVNTIIEP